MNNENQINENGEMKRIEKQPEEKRRESASIANNERSQRNGWLA